MQGAGLRVQGVGQSREQDVTGLDGRLASKCAGVAVLGRTVAGQLEQLCREVPGVGGLLSGLSLRV